MSYTARKCWTPTKSLVLLSLMADKNEDESFYLFNGISARFLPRILLCARRNKQGVSSQVTECKGLQLSGNDSAEPSSCLEKEQICQSLYWLIHSESLPHKSTLCLQFYLRGYKYGLVGKYLSRMMETLGLIPTPREGGREERRERETKGSNL